MKIDRNTLLIVACIPLAIFFLQNCRHIPIDDQSDQGVGHKPPERSLAEMDYGIVYNIECLASDFLKERVDAQRELIAIGVPALAQLRRAASHPYEIVRNQSQEIVRTIEKNRDLAEFKRNPALRIHAFWFSRKFKNIDQLDFENIFKHLYPFLDCRGIIYAPLYEVSDHLESDNGEEFAQMKGPCGVGGRLGGKKHRITQDMVDTVKKNNGFAYLGEVDESDAEDCRSLLISLPRDEENPAFDSYIIVFIDMKVKR